MRAGITRIITPPAREPVTLEEAKAHLRVDGADSDLAIAGLIESAREQVESATRRALISRTLEVYFDAFSTCMNLPRPPLQSVASVEYIDAEGAWQTADSVLYTVDNLREPGAVLLAPSQSWPEAMTARNAVRITCTAGYGLEREDVPEPLRQSVLFALQGLYDHDTLNYEILNRTRDALLAPYRVQYV